MIELLKLVERSSIEQQAENEESKMKNEPIVELRQISKAFPPIIANEKIDFNIKAGEIHALLGEKWPV